MQRIASKNAFLTRANESFSNSIMSTFLHSVITSMVLLNLKISHKTSTHNLAALKSFHVLEYITWPGKMIDCMNSLWIQFDPFAGHDVPHLGRQIQWLLFMLSGLFVKEFLAYSLSRR